MNILGFFFLSCDQPEEPTPRGPKVDGFMSRPSLSPFPTPRATGAPASKGAPPATKEKLKEVASRFNGFNQVLEKGVAARKREQDRAINGVRTEVEGVELRLRDEVASRVSAMEALELRIEARIRAVDEKWEAKVTEMEKSHKEELSKASGEIEELRKEIGAIRAGTREEELAGLIAKNAVAIEGAKAMALKETKELSQGQVELMAELGSAVEKLNDRIAKDRASWERSIFTLREDLTTGSHSLEKTSEKFRMGMIDELKSVALAVEAERVDREREAEEITATLDSVVEAVKSSMGLIVD